jgi:hypothetical protein
MDAKNRATGYIAEIDPAELTVRLIECGCKMKRPEGHTGRAAWEQFEQAARAGTVPEYIIKDFEAMAHIAIAYFGECIDALQRRN